MTDPDTLSERRARLSPSKQALLEKWKHAGAEPAANAIPRRPGSGPAPLSLAQERLWFLDRMEPGAPVYNLSLAIHLGGRLDVEALRQSLDALVRRHAALRTTFTLIDDLPAQVIAVPQPLLCPIMELSAIAQHERMAAAQGLMTDAMRQPFNLEQGPLVRATLLRLGDQEHVLLLVMHHIISDGWSQRILLRELLALYEAAVAGRSASLAAPPIQYADFAIWQREHLQGQILGKQLAYWRSQLAGAPAALALPTDRPHPLTRTYQGAQHHMRLPAALMESLQMLSRQEGATLYMTLLAAFNALLSRYTGQHDLLVGSPVANRSRSEIEGVVGFFVNTLVLRTDLSGDPSFHQLLARVRIRALEAHANADTPFEKVVEIVRPERDLGRTPLFQVMFLFQNVPLPDMERGPLSARLLHVESETTQFDLILEMSEAVARFEYNTDIFDAATIARIAGHFETLLSAIAVDPALPVSRLPLLTEAERRQLLVEWNATAAPFPAERCIQHIFEAQVARTPSEGALACDGATLTFAELNVRANQLAHHLQSLGVGPEVRVGLCVERSFEMVVALLGILKAGGAFVPLDPAYPADRLRFMLDDAQVAVLLTAQEQKNENDHPHDRVGTTERKDVLHTPPAAHAPPVAPGQPTVVDLVSDWHHIAKQPATNPDSAATPDSLAYLIYTSGSTGQPKGVLGLHCGVLNRCAWMWATYPFAPDEVLCQKTALSFVDSIWEIFGPLLGGCKLVIIPQDVLLDPWLLVQTLAQQQVTRLVLVPSLLRTLLESCPNLDQELPRLHTWSSSGEALPAELARQFCEHLPGRTLLNLYGSSEVAADTLYYDTRSQPPGEIVPIGQPIANTQAYVLDAAMRPVPVGVVGQLYTGGAGLARGYHNRPDLTAERFVPNPFADCRLAQSTIGNRQSAMETRLYKTGDLARYRPDGNIEYLGRIDHQVKVRGFRIELGEIEEVLRRHREIREAAVVARDEGGHTRLLAYVVTTKDKRQKTKDEEGDPSSFVLRPSSFVQELRAFLKQNLPDYMVPTAFVVLETLPLTPSGKVDHKALPAPDPSRPDLENVFVAPRTAVEQVLAQIWSELLGLTQVGIYDNFFSLGGHSLLATQVVARLRAALGVELPLRRIFEAPTISMLAEQVAAAHQTDAEMPPLVPVAHDRPLPLSFAQQRIWFLDRLDPGRATYTIPIALRLTGPLDLAAFQHSLTMIVARHAALRTTIIIQEGQPMQVIAPAGSEGKLTAPYLPLIDLQPLPEAERMAAARRLLAAEAHEPFDLARGPLLRLALLRLTPDVHVLLLTLHHIIADGWSLRVLVRELAALYTTLHARQPAQQSAPLSVLSALPIQYADYAVWQAGWMQGEVLETQLAYWRRSLAGIPPVIDLPTDWPRAAVRTFRGARQQLLLPQDLSEALTAISQREGATPFMVLLAAFKVLLQRYTGQPDIVVGTPIAGRSRGEIEGLIGCFLNTLVLRTDLSGDPSFHELLRRVREVCLGAYAHQDMPFEKLIEELQPERDLSYTPLFQVFFNMLNFPDRRLTLPGLTLAVLESPEIGAKFDITLYVDERDRRFHFDLVYNADLFAPERMRGLLDQLELLLAQVAQRPEEAISALSLVTDQARALLPDPTEPLDATWEGAVHTALARQARRVPGRPALIDPHESWTYAELDARSNQLANHLIAHDIQREDVVAIYAHRSAPLVWALMGVLKAGAAFTILDPAYPPARLISYLRLARPRGWIQLAVAGPPPDELEQFVAAMPLLCRVELPRDPDAARNLLTGLSTDDPAVEVGPETLACVGFTSGSTGTPKGILGLHGPLTHFLPWQCGRFGLGAADRFSMLSGMAHDPLQRDIFTPLWLGATICIPEPEDFYVPGRLAAWMQQAEISVAHLTPALGQLLTETAPDTTIQILSLRYAFIVGDVLTDHDVARIRSLAPAITCVNFYGSTETQRALGYYLIGDELAGGGPSHGRRKAILPLGQGMRDVQLLVLNAAQQLTGVGEVGEIYVRSPHLARGYIDDGALTHERFLPNLFRERVDLSASPLLPVGDRMYRTGDLGRYRPDGNVEFFGRADQQVKIRGFRVELGEIEAALAQHPQVREAAVVAHAGEDGEKQLVAYIVTTVDDRRMTIDDGSYSEPSSIAHRPSSFVGDLRDFIKSRLPSYMVPAAFVALPSLPLTPNGKIDRRALLADTTPALERAGGYVAPRTPNEEVVGAIWADILRLERVGVHDNFFAIGGHSLLATRLLARLGAAFHVELPVRVIFEAPTVAGLTGRIEQALRDERGAAPPILPVGQVDHLPLSFAQQRLWFLDQLDPNSSTYNIAMAIRLAGTLDVAALECSFDTLLQRHTALRTVFVSKAGHPAQVIMPAAPMVLPLVELRRLPAAERMEEARRLAAAEARRPFDLARDPLLRAGLLRTAEEEHILLVTTHHIVFDGSREVFFRELTTLYNAFVERMPVQLPELPVQYVDFAHWQRRWLAGEVMEAQLAYWRCALDGAPAALELPTDRPRPSMQTFHGARHTFALPPSLTRDLKALCRQEGVTLFMTMLAAFQILLKRYSNQDRISVGTPIAQRSQAAVEHLIGCFVNTLVLHTDLSSDPSFRTLLGRVREVALGAYAHQDTPFEMLVEALQPQRDPSRNPFYQVMFVLQHAAGNVEFAGLTAASLTLDRKTARFDMLLSCWESADRLHGMVEYNTDLFDAATIARMFEHFQNLLEAIMAQPDRRIGDLPLLSEAERRQMLMEWNDTPAPYEQDVCMHQLFERQAARDPHALAVVFSPAGAGRPDEALTYGELNRWANQLAHQLRALGAGPGAMVAVYLDRSPEMIVAVLGVLKAGGVYVPLEVSFPRPRMQWIMASLGVRYIITQGAQLQHIAALQADLPMLAHVVCLDEPGRPEHANGNGSAELAPHVRLWDTIDLERRLDTNLPATIDADALAYVIFTSGSTGQPKGVMVRHRPVINLIEWVNRTFDVNAADRLLFVTSLCFDLSVYDIFGMLAAGGSIRVVADADLRDPESLLRMLRAEPITFWDSAPAALQQLVPFFPPAPAATSRLRLVFLSGDWIPVTLPDQVRTTFRGAQVISLGGATEATVWSNFYPIGAVEPHWGSIPYGKPIQNARYYILDAALNPCPIGVEGALYIGGECLCEGYAGQPDLTAERFIPNPFAEERPGDPETRRHGDAETSQSAIGNRQSAIGTRLYRTGDQARYLPDGTMIFLGRRDQQVKIRGFRIELGEIESVLGAHPDVRDVAVLAREDTPGDKRLVAYVIPAEDEGRRTKDESASSSSVLRPSSPLPDLREFLKDRLPEYMLPSAFVVLDALPLTANGKLDRHALPAPWQEQSEEHAAPRTPVEQVLAAIWGEVLRVDQVGIYDNFFALGGDSILSIQIIAHARQRGLHLTTRDMFRNQTIAELAAGVGSGPAMVAEQELLTGPAPLTPVQRWFFEHDFTAPEQWNQAVLLETRRPLDYGLLERSLQQLVAHHDALRLCFTREDGAWYQAYTAPDGSACCQMIDLAGVPEQQQARAITAECERIQAGLDLARGHLLRAALFDLGPQARGRLLIVIHHLAVDGVSWQIVLEDLQAVYEQLERGEIGQLPPKTTSFRTWGERLAAYAQSAAVREQLGYWRDQPWADYEPLPLDMPDGANTEESAEHVTVKLDPATTGRLLNDVTTMQHAQAEELLLAALARAFAHWSGAEALLIDLEGHGREALFDDVDLSRTVGWHTSIAPALLHAPLDEPPGAMLQRVKEQLRRVPAQGVGYGLLRYLDLAGMEVLAALPRPEVSFNYWGHFALADSETGLFAGARESPGAAHAGLNVRTHVLEISGVIRGPQLHFTWNYSRNLYRRATIEWLAETFLETLRDFVASVEAGEIGYAPSDFPLTQLNQQQLDKLVEVIERKS
jgi:amino acid adenylation domain-containing protein/non-ribosomal peptide synthase protein (TIGR01720 family)